MTICEYLIIGSGPAGISAAWPLVMAGKSVTMVDGGFMSVPSMPVGNIENFRDSGESYIYSYGHNLKGLGLDKNVSPKFSTLLGQSILNSDSFSSKLTLQNFFAIQALATGGQSLVWGAFCSAFDNVDLHDYPIKISDLADSYKFVSSRIGISGDRDDLDEFHGSNYYLQKPPGLTPVLNDLYQKYLKQDLVYSEYLLGRARNAVITQNNNHRFGCNECGLCLYGCSRKSIYRSDFDLQELKSYQNFKYIKKAKVTKLIRLDGNTKEVEINGETKFTAKVLIMAAGTISTTAMIMDYAGIYGERIPLLTNPCAAMVYITPRYINSGFMDRSFGLGQLSYKLSLACRDEYVTGVIYGADTLPLDFLSRYSPFSSRSTLKISSMLMPAMLPTTIYLSSKYSKNSISLNKVGSKYEITIDGENLPEAMEQITYSKNKISKHMRNFGSYYVPGSLSLSIPGGDAHLAGTIPMGSKNRLGSNNYGELNIAENVYVVDGSALTFLPPKHCTFTIMANSDRISRYLTMSSNR